jgi:intracellular multiplication protein IcmJ
MKELYSLTLRAVPGAWRIFSARKGDQNFRAFAQKVYQRDNYTCQFCGFQAKEYQEIVNLNHDYRANKISNLVTACCFCVQCLFIESIGVEEYGGGTLIYMPEITQGQLNAFCHVLFCAITNDTGYKSSAQTIYRTFKFRSQMVEDKFGEGSSDPAAFAQLLLNVGMDGDYQKTEETILKNICLLPSMSKFRKQIERWAATALEELSK